MYFIRLLVFLILHFIPVIKMFHIKKDAEFRTKNNSPLFPTSEKIKNQLTYDITHWIDKFHLQQCVFIEIGEGFCALFVEIENVSEMAKNPEIDELFLGICDCATLRSWELCSPELMKIRRKDCIFTEATATANTSARVHRRLCEINFLKYLPICKCSQSLASQTLHKTEGFPTCFLNPLPKSICFPRGVCGVAKCSVKTIMGIHSSQCDPNCHQKQPFCEELGPWTSIAPKITSSWSKWSEPKCNVSCGRGSLVSEAFCGKKNIDCIGPGPFCCSNITESCKCKVTIENGIMKANRYTEPCTRSISCPIVLRRRGFLPENQFKESESYGIDEYEEFNQEKVDVESLNDYQEPLNLSRRRLLGNLYYDMDNYEIMNKDDNEEFENNEINKRIVGIDDVFDDDDKDYDSATENSSDNIENNEEENNEEMDNKNIAMVVTTAESNDYETVYEDTSSGSLVKTQISLLVFIIFVNLKTFLII